MSITVTPLLMPNEDHVLTKEEALVISGKCLAMCYEHDNFDKIKEQTDEKSITRARACIKSGHHSGFEHVKWTFEIIGLSKFLAMIINNVGKYATSEKSGRYTVLAFDDEREKELREKWQDIFYNILSEEYYDLFYNFYSKDNTDKEKIEKNIKTAITKKAQENSRNITSIWAKTKMIYTIDARMLSYLVYYLKDFINTYSDTPLYKRLKNEMEEFIAELKPYSLDEEGLTPASKGSKLPFFGDVSKREEEFGENYTFVYKMSWSTFAQKQRHRTTHHEIQIPDEKEYYVPKLIEDKPELKAEWLNDCKAMTTEDSFPQATLIDVCERGRYEDFILMCYERLCGAAQLEIATAVKELLERYIKNVTKLEVKEALEKINAGARCTFGYKCTAPCMFGPKYGLDRKF